MRAPLSCSCSWLRRCASLSRLSTCSTSARRGKEPSRRPRTREAHLSALHLMKRTLKGRVARKFNAAKTTLNSAQMPLSDSPETRNSAQMPLSDPPTDAAKTTPNPAQMRRFIPCSVLVSRMAYFGIWDFLSPPGSSFPWHLLGSLALVR